MSNAHFIRTTVSASAIVAALAIAQLAHGETILSVTQTNYDNRLQPICQTVRMNPAIYGSLPADACTLGTEGSYGPDRVTKNTYDAAGQLTQVDQAYGTLVQRAYARYTYSNNGLKTTERDANGNTTTYEYDGFDRLSKLRYPVTTVNSTSSSTTDYEQFGYDNNGNKTSWRRRDGNTFGYTYDNLNREIIKDIPGGSSADIYTNYDELGHIIWKRFTSTGGSGVSYAYDSLGRVYSTTDMNGRTVAYGNNIASQRDWMTYPDGQAQHYVYYATGAMYWTGITGGAVSINPNFNSLGQVTAIGRNNGAHSYYAYDALGRLSAMTNDMAGTGYDINWAWPTRNPAGQIQTQQASSTVYDYKEIASSTVNKTYDGLNRDAGIAALSGGYDARGNMTFDGVRTFTYDLENRLLTESAPGVSLSLEYDPEGRLSKYNSSGSVTTFLYDGVNLIGEYDGAGNMTKRYMHTLGTDQPWVQFNGSAVTAGNAQYLYANYQGSIIATADSSGAVTDMYKYGPYGEPKNGSNVDSWTGSRFRYTGQIMLPDARLYYYKARVYDPIAGRFLQTDPIGSNDDLDLYSYVGGDPINSTDPTGLCPNWCRYKTQDEAGTAGANDDRAKTDDPKNRDRDGHKVEYGGENFQRGDGSWGYTQRRGDRISVPVRPAPWFTKAHGDHHSHSENGKYDGEHFSSGDTQGNREQGNGKGEKGYLSTPSGAVKVYDPNGNSKDKDDNGQAKVRTIQPATMPPPAEPDTTNKRAR